MTASPNGDDVIAVPVLNLDRPRRIHIVGLVLSLLFLKGPWSTRIRLEILR